MTDDLERPPVRPLFLRLTTYLLGGWLLASALLLFVALTNFTMLKPERLDGINQAFPGLEVEQQKQGLHYLAGELNREIFRVYNLGQLGVAVLALGCLVVSRRPGKVTIPLLTVNLLLCLSFVLYFSPTLGELGREIAFMPRDPKPPEVKRFFMIHGINNLLELIN